MIREEAYLIKVEHKIKLTYIVKVLIQDLNKVVNCFKVIQVVVIDIHTDTEVQTSIPSVDNLEVPELHKIGMFGISYSDNYNFIQVTLILKYFNFTLPA